MNEQRTTQPEDQRRSALAAFLRARRARLAPSAVGLPTGSRRRTPGLRREEVAQLANIGTAWYTALEQQRDVQPSTGVLDSLAGALRLSADERRHLFMLAGRPLVVPPARTDEETVSAAICRMIDDLNPDPACVLGRRLDYLYWNRAAKLVFPEGLDTAPPPYERNFVWRLFTSAAPRREGWEEVARTVLAQFRAASARCTGGPGFAALIADLERASAEFRAWWPRHEVRGSLDTRKEIQHPLAGRLVLDRTTLQAPAAPDLSISVYTPAPGTDTACALRRLFEMSPGEPSPHESCAAMALTPASS
jgi:transcriptional regulator with XRE-family HTH domain